jgi:transaldolase
MNPLRGLNDHGQAVWLDYIERALLTGGGLGRFISDDGLTGVTSNPTIFDKALAGGSDYDQALAALIADDPGAPTKAIYESLAVEDIRMAADILAPVHERTAGADGFVSLEVSPHLAADTDGTVDEARRLWRAVDRPNVMIKVPATPEGIGAIATLIGEGINVNATLMFSLADYEAVAGAYIEGVGRAADPASVASVASFFVSRIDTATSLALDDIGSAEAGALKGRIAIANAKMAYARFGEIFGGDGFASLRAKGARVQRVLWASTGTKDPAFSDVLYVDELIGPDTVNTLPIATLDAFRDHGRPRRTIDQGLDEARDDLAKLKGLGIDLDAITARLQIDGVKAFADSFDQLIAGLDSKRLAIAS